jgi:hypothetical protein
MATPKQIATNRQNAYKPTGPEAGLASPDNNYLLYFLFVSCKIGFVWYFCYLAFVAGLDIRLPIPVKI